MNKDDTPFSENETKYDRLKKRVVSGFAESEEARLRNLFGSDIAFARKPSQFLMHLKIKAGNNFSEKALRSIFLDKMPQSIRGVLVTLEGQSLEELAEAADKIIEIAPQDAMSINKISTTNSNLNSDPIGQQSLRSLQDQVARLTGTVKKLLNQQATACSHREKGRGRSRARSASRNRKDFNGICYYHHKFGNDAYKCLQPCT